MNARESLLESLSDRVCDAAAPLLFAKGGSQVGELVESALECSSALLRCMDALLYIAGHPNGAGDHHPSVVARAALEGRESPRV